MPYQFHIKGRYLRVPVGVMSSHCHRSSQALPLVLVFNCQVSSGSAVTMGLVPFYRNTGLRWRKYPLAVYVCVQFCTLDMRQKCDKRTGQSIVVFTFCKIVVFEMFIASFQTLVKLFEKLYLH